MVFVIALAARLLGSKAIRRQIVNTGIRRFARSGAISRVNEKNEPENLWSAFGRTFGSIVGGVFTKFGDKFNFNFSKAWALISRSVIYLINFNWNTTDAQLEEQIKQAEIAISGAKGALAGQAVGYGICGFLPTAAIAVFNESAALQAYEELGEEFAEEMVAGISNLIDLYIEQAARRGFAALYKNFRHILRPAALKVAQFLVSQGVLDQESVDKANKNRKEPWSFAIALEETIDRIKDPNKKAYTENFWDELGEACVEAGYIVAAGLDAYFAEARMANRAITGNNKVIEIQPIRDPEPTTPAQGTTG